MLFDELTIFGEVAVAGADVVFVALGTTVAEEIIDGFIVDSFELVLVGELLLLFALFAWVKLPFITFRGNGFGLITSTII